MAKLVKVVFSPTGGSLKIVEKVAEGMGKGPGAEVSMLDLTQPEGRAGAALSCEEGDVLLFAFPVYTGRIPLTLREAFDGASGNGAKAAIVATYGNRHYDDAIREALDFLTERGFEVVAAATFSAEHSFTRNVGTGRPDEADLAKAVEFGASLAEKLAAGAGALAEVPGNFPYMDYQGVMPFNPKTSEACTSCGICADVCPTDNISAEADYDAAPGAAVGGACIQCCACVKACPVSAKFFDDAPLMGIVGMLEGNCIARREPEFFL